MTKDEIAANILIALIQKSDFRVLGTDPKNPQALVTAACDAYKKIYETVRDPHN